MPSFRVELHSHCQGDPVDTYLSHSIFEQIDRAREVGLDAIAITWHRKACIHPEADAYARERGILLISGMEAEIDRGHLIVLNLAENDLPPRPTWDEVRALRQRKPNIFVMAPHPFYPHPSCLGGRLKQNEDCIDAVEWCFLHVNWLPRWLNPNFRATRWAQKHGKTMIACSDAHALDQIGKNSSVVDADELSAPALFKAIRAGQVTFSRPELGLVPVFRQVGRVLYYLPKYLQNWSLAWLSQRRSGI